MPQSYRPVAVGAVVVWALLVGAAGAQRTPDDPSTVRYRGRVADTGGYPLPGTEVICTARGGATYRAKTDDKSEYALTSTTGACERIVFEQESFVSERFVSPATGVLDVSMNVVDVAQREWVAGAGRGLVVNDDGSPAVDASVWLWRIGGAAPAGCRTDSDGTFELALTDYAGDFVLCARGAGEGQRIVCLPVTGEPFPGGKARLKLPPRSK